MNRISKIQQQIHGEDSGLLSTKLALPRLRETLVEREALFKRLDEALEQRIILLSAPAGAGKTTLVRAWLDKRARCDYYNL